jgi:hypothetical protein
MNQKPTLEELIKRGDAAIERSRATIDESHRLGIQAKVKRSGGDRRQATAG